MATSLTADNNSPGSSVFDLPTVSARDATSADRGLATTELQSNHPAEASPSFVIVSGGTGGNFICPAFQDHAPCYVLPVSDDGGSSSEIIRVVGGPSIGDIRSRLVRLIPFAPPGSSLDAIRRLLEYRLSSGSLERDVRDEWRDIIEGRSHLWKGIPGDRKETIRGFLVYFENELLRCAHKNFSFRNGSVGNFFLAAMTAFFRSLPSAIFLFSSITQSRANVLPVIVTNHTVTIAAELADGSNLIGQCEISHPVRAGPAISITEPDAPAHDPSSLIETNEGHDGMHDTLAGSSSSQVNLMFDQGSKDEHVPLPSPISRIYYINAFGQEVRPSPNPDFISSLGHGDVLVYSCGSLWTSIMPCLALRGVGTAIARSHTLRAKILLLNAQNDRETEGYAASDYVRAIVRTLNAFVNVQASRGSSAHAQQTANEYPCSAFVTHLVYLSGTRVQVDVTELKNLGVRSVRVESQDMYFDASNVRAAIDGILSESKQ